MAEEKNTKKISSVFFGEAGNVFKNVRLFLRGKKLAKIAETEMKTIEDVRARLAKLYGGNLDYSEKFESAKKDISEAKNQSPAFPFLERSSRNSSKPDFSADESNLAFVPLSEIAKNSTYSKNYINFSARQGKLKARKIGGVWHTTEEWLAEFTEKSKAKKNKFKEKLSHDLGGNKKFAEEKAGDAHVRPEKEKAAYMRPLPERFEKINYWLSRKKNNAKKWFSELGEMDGEREGELTELKKARLSNFLKLDYAKPALAMIALVLLMAVGNITKADLGYWRDRGEKKIYFAYNAGVDGAAKIVSRVNEKAGKQIANVKIGKEKFVKIADEYLRREKIKDFEKNSGLSLIGDEESAGEVAGVESPTPPSRPRRDTSPRAGEEDFGNENGLVLAAATDGTQMNIGDIEVSAYLMDGENREIQNGEYDVRFGIYTTDRTEADPYPSDRDLGSRVWEEAQKVVIENGLMRTYLGKTSPVPASFNFAANNFWVGIRIGEDAEMVPRKRIGAIPLARTAMNIAGQAIGNGAGNIPLSNGTLNTNLNADLLDGKHASAFMLAGTSLTGDYDNYQSWKLAASATDVGQKIKSNKAAIFTGSNGITTARSLNILTVSPTYGSTSGTIAEGSTAITVNTTGNLSGGGAGSAGGGINLTLDTIASPTFTGLTVTGDLNLTASTNLIFGGTTSLGEFTNATDSGAYLVGVSTAGFGSSASNNVQDVLSDLDAAIGGGGGGLWSLAGGVIYPTALANNFAIGGATLATSMFGIDQAAGNFYYGYDNTANPTFLFEATDSDAGTFGFNTNDAFYFSDANVGIGTTNPIAALDINKSSTSGTAGNEYANYIDFSDTGAVAAGTDNTYGSYINVARTGATGGTINTYGQYIKARGNDAGGGTSNLYGSYLDLIINSGADNVYGVTSNISGIGTMGQNLYGVRSFVSNGVGDTSYGIYSVMSGGGASDRVYGIYSLAYSTLADSVGYGLFVDTPNIFGENYYAAAFMGGNVGIGDSSPSAALTVGNGDLFRVSSAGAIAAATGITSSGTITFSSIANDGVEATGILINGANQLVSREFGTLAFSSATYDNYQYWELQANGAAGQNIASTGAASFNGGGIVTTSRAGNVLTITGTEADTLAAVTGRGATTTDQLAFNYNVGAPFTVFNNTVVTNLNSDYLDGQHGAYYAAAASISGTDNFIPRFNGTSALENSIIYDTGTNIGIGYTAPGSKLTVSGGVGIGTTSPSSVYLTTAAPDGGMIIEGNVGIGTYVPTAKLVVSGNLLVDDVAGANNIGVNVGSVLNANANSSYMRGIHSQLSYNIGAYTDVIIRAVEIDMMNSFTAGAGHVLENTQLYIATPFAVPAFVTNSYAIFSEGGANYFGGKVGIGTSGIGTTAPGASLQVNGNAVIGYSSNMEGPVNGLAISGNVGIGTTAPGNKLTVSGGVGIGTTAPGSVYLSTAAPDGGMIIEGNVGIGTTSPTAQLSLQSIAANESGVLGAEIVDGTGWTAGAGWTNNYPSFPHTAGTATLTRSGAATSGVYYQVLFTVSGRTTGSVAMTYGGNSSGTINADGSYNVAAKSTGTGILTFTPTTDFDGTISGVSIKVISAYLATSNILDSAGASNFEIRSTLASLNNTFLGKNSGTLNTTGYQNSTVGVGALQYNTTGYGNVAQGYNALKLNTTGVSNTAVGANALDANTSGFWSVAVGYDALTSQTSGGGNTAVGHRAMSANTTGLYNIAIGYASLLSNSTGQGNVAIGGLGSTTGSYNTAVGASAGNLNQTGTGNLFLGRDAGVGAVTYTGSDYNTIVGYEAGKNIGNSQDYNVFLGYQAGYSSTGSNKLWIANSSTTSLIYGDFSTGAVGIGGTAASTTPYLTILAGGNVGIGTTSPDGKLHVMTASAGTVTANALADDLTVENSGQVGLSILSPDDEYGSIVFGTPSDNLGAYIQWMYSTGMMYIGPHKTGGQIQLSTDVDAIRIAADGDVGIGTTNPGYKLDIDAGASTGLHVKSTSATALETLYCESSGANGCGGNQAWYSSSDLRLKTDVVTIDDALNKVLQLRGVNFRWRSSLEPDMGFIAQEVKDVVPEIVGQDANGYYGMRTSQLTALLVEAVKGQQGQITTLETRNTTLDLKISQTAQSTEELQAAVNDKLNLIGQSLALGEANSLALGQRVSEIESKLTSAQTKLQEAENNLAAFETATNDTLSAMLDTENMLTERVLDHEDRIAALESQIAAVTISAGEELPANVITMDQDGNAALAGIFSAKEVVAGAFSVKTDDPEKRTMGEETILAGESEKSVLTNAIAATSKIFVTFENDPGARYWIEKTTNPETGEFLGFVLKLSVAAVGDAKFSWWIVESR